VELTGLTGLAVGVFCDDELFLSALVTPGSGIGDGPLLLNVLEGTGFMGLGADILLRDP